MKINVLLFLLVSIIYGSNNLYDIHFTALGGGDMNMSSFRGKKVVVMTFNGAHPYLGLISYLDSLQKKVPGICVIAVPGMEFDSTVNETSLISLRDSLHLSIIIARPAYLKKAAGGNQHPLLKWLTDVTQNTHFGRDVEEDSQLFIISEKGTLYGLLLGRQTSVSIINDVIQRKVSE
jgi:glutathione peroxidase-family protein